MDGVKLHPYQRTFLWKDLENVMNVRFILPIKTISFQHMKRCGHLFIGICFQIKILFLITRLIYGN